MRAAVETGHSWFVHFRHTKRPISTLTRTLKMITESDIIWTISIMILFRSLNDQENGHDLRCLTAISVKKVASPAVLPPKFFLRSWCYWLTIVSSCLITVIVNIFTWVIAISSNLKFCRMFLIFGKRDLEPFAVPRLWYRKKNQALLVYPGVQVYQHTGN